MFQASRYWMQRGGQVPSAAGGIPHFGPRSFRIYSASSSESPASTRSASATNLVGDASGFAPPGDIHRVRNTSDEIAISIHVYGTDVTRIGSSVRRFYD